MEGEKCHSLLALSDLRGTVDVKPYENRQGQEAGIGGW